MHVKHQWVEVSAARKKLVGNRGKDTSKAKCFPYKKASRAIDETSSSVNSLLRSCQQEVPLQLHALSPTALRGHWSSALCHVQPNSYKKAKMLHSAPHPPWQWITKINTVPSPCQHFHPHPSFKLMCSKGSSSRSFLFFFPCLLLLPSSLSLSKLLFCSWWKTSRTEL